MLNNDYNYNETLKRIISVFGTIFNNIHIARKDGSNTSNLMRVPISYGPREKFLARINAKPLESEGKMLAIKLPRMSFEITGITYSPDKQLNKLNRNYVGCDTDDGLRSAWEEVPYDIGISLSIYGNAQDDLFQIVEQILPTFSPSYTVSIKGLVGDDTVYDVPFTLTSVNLDDQYEGDFNTRRAIIHTLDFTAKAAFAGRQTDIGVIEEVIVNFYDQLISEVDYELLPVSSINITER